MEKLVLENSSNTHVLEAKSKIVKSQAFENGIMLVETAEPNAIVTHGEHGTLTVQSNRVYKYIQQEYNPISGKIMNAID